MTQQINPNVIDHFDVRTNIVFIQEDGQLFEAPCNARHERGPEQQANAQKEKNCSDSEQVESVCRR